MLRPRHPSFQTLSDFSHLTDNHLQIFEIFENETQPLIRLLDENPCAGFHALIELGTLKFFPCEILKLKLHKKCSANCKGHGKSPKLSCLFTADNLDIDSSGRVWLVWIIVAVN